jgi:hypothetical protein
MAADSQTGGLETLSGHPKRRPEYQNTINLGQIGQILAILGLFGGVVMFNRTETEAIRSSAAVRDERIVAVQKDVQTNKEQTERAAAAQKEVLSEIKGDVKAVSNAVQSLTLQVQLNNAQQGRSKP